MNSVQKHNICITFNILNKIPEDKSIIHIVSIVFPICYVALQVSTSGFFRSHNHGITNNWDTSHKR
jgi:hypothetical protein